MQRGFEASQKVFEQDQVVDNAGVIHLVTSNSCSQLMRPLARVIIFFSFGVKVLFPVVVYFCKLCFVCNFIKESPLSENCAKWQEKEINHKYYCINNLLN